MTDDELKAIRERWQAAVTRKWETAVNSSRVEVGPMSVGFAYKPIWNAELPCRATLEEAELDAKDGDCAPSDIAALLAEVERLRATLAALPFTSIHEPEDVSRYYPEDEEATQ